MRYILLKGNSSCLLTYLNRFFFTLATGIKGINFEPRYEAFYNCVAYILIAEQDENAPVLILTGTAASGTEQYKVRKIGIGDSKTFGKTSGVHGTPAGRKLVMPVQDSLDAIVNTVSKVLDIVVSAHG